jgi:transposase InsO family protein
MVAPGSTSSSKTSTVSAAAASGSPGSWRRPEFGVAAGVGPFTTTNDHAAVHAHDLLERDFTVIAPDQRWVADITYREHLAGPDLSRLRARSLLPARGGLVDANRSQDRAGLRRAQHGDRQPQTR